MGPTARRESQSTSPAPWFRGSAAGAWRARMQGTAVLRVNYKTPSLAVTEPRGTKEITPRRTAHEGLKVPPNAPDGLVVSYIPLVSACGNLCIFNPGQHVALGFLTEISYLKKVPGGLFTVTRRPTAPGSL